MTPLHPEDPLVALWQTIPKSNTRHLVKDLQHLNGLHKRLNRTVLAIVCGVDVLLVFEEATGRIASHGILSGTWTLALAIGLVCHWRARCNRSDALTLDTVSLLKSMIARAKSDLLIARCLYAGVPCGAAGGYIATKLAGVGGSPPTSGFNPHLRTIQTAAGIAALIVMMFAGAVLARSRRLQVHELSDKLRSITDDL
jgi:hypothetical protein